MADITERRGAASIVLSTIREDSQFIVDHIARRQAADIITLCDEIERLRAQVGDESALATAAYMSGAHDTRAEIASLKAENARLREALKPFAGHYQSWMDRYADDITSTTFPIHTFGDLRRARKALEGGE